MCWHLMLGWSLTERRGDAERSPKTEDQFLPRESFTVVVRSAQNFAGDHGHHTLVSHARFCGR